MIQTFNDTFTTVVASRVSTIINPPSGQRVYLVTASYHTDVDSATAGLTCQDGTPQLIVCTTTATSTTVTSAALFGAVGSGPVFVGMKVTGTGIAANTYVTAKASDSSITISVAATATGTPTLTFKGEPRFFLKGEPAAAGVAIEAFRPAIPIPISDAGQQAIFILDATTTARLSLNYGFGP